jgi:ABC-type nitrate/sulfonate/bicarbonate transport system permease component
MMASVLRAAKRAVLPLLGLVGAVLMWALIADLIGNPARLPTPLVVERFLRANFFHTAGISYAGLSGNLWSNALFTAQHTLRGFAIGALAGYLAGLALRGRALPVQVSNLWLVTAGSVPAVILTPFVVIWFGPNGTAEFVIVAFYAFVLVAIASQNSAAYLSERYTSFARTLGAGRRHIALSILLPGCLPAALAVARVALAVGWGLEVATELFGANRGVGRLVLYYQQTGNPAGIIGSILVLASLALVVELTLRAIAAAGLRWREPTQGGSL